MVLVWVAVRARLYQPSPRSVTVGVIEANAAPFLERLMVRVAPVLPVTWSDESVINTIRSRAVL